jgi:hypothetical protein
MSVEQYVQQWVSLDNQLKLLNEKTREMREKRDSLEEDIVRHFSNSNRVAPIINISDGKLRVAETRVPEPITFKYLEKTLSEIIKNESQVKTIIDYIKKRRNVKVVSEIKRYYNN